MPLAQNPHLPATTNREIDDMRHRLTVGEFGTRGIECRFRNTVVAGGMQDIVELRGELAVSCLSGLDRHYSGPQRLLIY